MPPTVSRPLEPGGHRESFPSPVSSVGVFFLPGARGRGLSGRHSASAFRKTAKSRNFTASGTSDELIPTIPSWTASGNSNAIGS